MRAHRRLAWSWRRAPLFVFANLHPDQILSSAVPAGGDMGAHVWGPAFLRDHLLPEGRLSGWTPDWYAGFPAYQFYMVIPSLLIVALDVGLFGGWAMIIPLAAPPVRGAWRARGSTGWRRWALVAAGGRDRRSAAWSCPYGTAFKLVTVLGVVSLPVCVYAFGRLADLPFPGPALLSVASVLFLFDRNFTIYGGNVASTLAGEFAFSISLSLALLYLGVVMRGLRTGRAPRPGRRAARPHRAVPPDPRLLRPGRHRGDRAAAPARRGARSCGSPACCPSPG